MHSTHSVRGFFAAFSVCRHCMLQQGLSYVSWKCLSSKPHLYKEECHADLRVSRAARDLFTGRDFRSPGLCNLRFQSKSCSTVLPAATKVSC